MCSSSYFGNHATKLCVECGLGGDHAGPDAEATIDDRGGGLVATRFDCQQQLVQVTGGGHHGRDV